MESTAKPADALQENHRTPLESDRHLAVVDCVSAGRGDHPHDTTAVKYVESPSNLTRYGVKVTEIIEFEGADDRRVAGKHSLSQLLPNAGLDQTYQCFQFLGQQTAAENIPLIAVINNKAHDEQAVKALYEQFDCLLVTRSGRCYEELGANRPERLDRVADAVMTGGPPAVVGRG